MINFQYFWLHEIIEFLFSIPGMLDANTEKKFFLWIQVFGPYA